MKQLSTHATLLVIIIFSLVASATPSAATALVWLGTEVSSTTAPPILITEIQTGAGTASDEFIEVYNRSDKPVDITGWQIRVANAGAEPSLLVAVASASTVPVIVDPFTHYVVATAGLAASANQAYTAGLSKTDKTMALYAPDLQTCQLTVQDAVAWQSGTIATKGEGAPVSVPTDKVSKEKLLQRYRDVNGFYADTDNNATDFLLSTATPTPLLPSVALGSTPGSLNTQLVADQSAPGSPSSLSPIAINGCTIPAPPSTGDPPETVPEPEDSTGGTGNSGDPSGEPSSETPGSEQGSEDGQDQDPEPGTQPEAGQPNAGLISPQITEILPNPAPPQADEYDEFIELFNPNDQPFVLTGCILEVGTTTKHRYIFPAGTMLPAGAYIAFFSVTTGLSLSNSGGQARLLDPQAVLLAQTAVYTTAKDGQAWAMVDGVWQWSTTASPNGANVIVAAATVSKTTTTTSTAKKPAAPKAVKAATTKNTVKTPKPKTTKLAKPKADTTQTVAAIRPDKGSLHTGVLAGFGIFALLYGAYEYRRDLANKLHQFRTDRAARRANRQKAARR